MAKTQGSADVVYAKRSDAFAAPKRYNNVQLDGRPMRVEVVSPKSEVTMAACINVVGGANVKATSRIVMTYNQLRKKFPATSLTRSPVLSDAGFDLLNILLTYDPEKRITADAALKHEWFCEVPLPKSKEFMPTFPAQHVQDRRMRRVLKSPDPLDEQRMKELRQAELGTGGLFG